MTTLLIVLVCIAGRHFMGETLPVVYAGVTVWLWYWYVVLSVVYGLLALGFATAILFAKGFTLKVNLFGIKFRNAQLVGGMRFVAAASVALPMIGAGFLLAGSHLVMEGARGITAHTGFGGMDSQKTLFGAILILIGILWNRSKSSDKDSD